MNDKEIIKALEQHIERTKNIKYGARKKILVDAEFLKNIFDLINRQRAENERLESEISISQHLLSDAWRNIESMDKLCKTARAEAIKEFVHEIFSPFKDKAYLSKRDLEIIVNNLAKYY